MKTWSDIKLLLKNIAGKGFFNLLSANMLIQIVAFASQLIVAGILSPEDVGRIKILQTWLSIFSILGSMGFNSSTLKLCSENRSRDEIKGIFRSGLLFTLFSTLAAYAIVLIINSLGLLSKETLIRSMVPLALLPLIANGLFAVYVSYYQARKEIRFISNITSVNKLVAVLLIVFFTFQLGIKGYYIGFNIAAFSLLIIVYFITQSKQKKPARSTSNRKLFQTHWKYARPSFFSVLLADLTAYADILIINFLLISDMMEVGFYSFALTLTVAFRVLPATVQQITIPYFSGMADAALGFKNVYKRYSRILVLIIIATLAAALLIFPPLIDFIFKGKYNASMPYFLPLAIGWSIRQYNQIQAAALFGKGAIADIAKSQVLALIINVLIIVIALQIWGLTGAAWASILCALSEVLFFYFFMRRNKI